ncbi:acyltransferase family protein [Candidatus Saccharibacteria bacterium]|nr:acyltransferase family protein [Candidatus Saccharibacteria bacterium]
MVDYSISLTRFVAMVLIVLCHILQGFVHSELAFWANVGVQMFLLISGILYGSRTLIATEPVPFWRKTFRKILVKYYIYVLIIVAILVLTHTANLGMPAYSILPWVKFQPTATGYEHVWFIKCILACYLLTPAWHWVLSAQKDRTAIYLIKLAGMD